MSQESTIIIKSNKISPSKVNISKPIMVKKENKIKLIQWDPKQVLLKNIKIEPTYKDRLIFESKPGGFVGNSPVKVSIVNRLDTLRKITKTIITYYDQLNGKELSVKTSDRISRFIGQSNYETVLNALCAIEEEEIKVNAIMALLTNELVENRSTQTEEPDLKPHFTEIKIEKSVEEKICQTEENCMDLILKLKQKKRVKRSTLTPYVVKDPPTKVVRKCIVNISADKVNKRQNSSVQCPTVDSLQSVDIEDPIKIPELSITGLSDNESDGNITLSGSLCGDEFLHPKSIFESIDQRTANNEAMVITVPPHKYLIPIPNDKPIEVFVKPELPFHVATPDILSTLSNEDKVKLISYQAFLDFKWCLERDSDGYLPIHNAVNNNDVDLLRRQCVVLKYRQQSVDITAANNLTALQISIYQDTPQCTALLIQHGADPLLTDEEHKTCLHLACESSLDNLRAIIKNCESTASEILRDHDELWRPEYETKSKEELAAILLKHMCELHNSDGYTPLMVCAKLGNYCGVKTLLEASPGSIDLPMPNSGCTALFLAIEGACHDSTNRGNKSKVADHYYQTISILLQNGADNNVSNYGGTTISELLAENCNTELSTLLANKATSNKFFSNDMPKTFDNYMLIKEENGGYSVEELKKKKPENKNSKKSPKNAKNSAKGSNVKVEKSEIIVKKEKPIILENIPIASIAPSPKSFIDVKPLNANPNIRIIPKDMLLPKNTLPQTSSNSSLKPVVLTKVLEEKYIVPANVNKTDIKQHVIVKPIPPVVKVVEKEHISLPNLNVPSVINKKLNEIKKRKSNNSPGPSEKKSKMNKAT